MLVLPLLIIPQLFRETRGTPIRPASTIGPTQLLPRALHNSGDRLIGPLGQETQAQPGPLPARGGAGTRSTVLRSSSGAAPAATRRSFHWENPGSAQGDSEAERDRHEAILPSVLGDHGGLLHWVPPGQRGGGASRKRWRPDLACGRAGPASARPPGWGAGLPEVCRILGSTFAASFFSPQVRPVASPEPLPSRPSFLSLCPFNCLMEEKNGTFKSGISEAPANGIGSGGGVLRSRRNSKAKIVPPRCRARGKCRSSFGGVRLLAPEAGQDWRTLRPSD